MRSASVGANYLLNVGPTAEGEMLPVHVQRLREMGLWLHTNGDSIYGTRAGKIAPTTGAVSMSKGDTHYIHLLDYISDCVKLETPANATCRALLLHDGSAVRSEIKDGMLVLTVPAEQRDPIDTVVALTSTTQNQ